MGCIQTVGGVLFSLQSHRYIICSHVCCSRPVKILLSLCCVCKDVYSTSQMIWGHVAEVWERLLVHCNLKSNLFAHSFILSSCVSFGFAGSTDRWVAFKELGQCFFLCNLMDRYIICSHGCCSKPVKMLLPLCCVCKDIFNKPNDLRNMLQRFERVCWSTAIQTPTFLLWDPTSN